MEREMTMVEQVAQALAIADGMHPEATSNDDDEQPAWTLYVGMAKAAIEAMRHHTPAMDSAGYDAYPDSVIRTGVDHLDIYRAMIDAALKEHEEGKVG